MNTCEFCFIWRRTNKPIKVKGIEIPWPELQLEFGCTGAGYLGATHYKTISSDGPQLFAVVDKKWALYYEGGTWRRYTTARDFKFDAIHHDRLNSKEATEKHEDESWVIVPKEDYDIELVDYDGELVDYDN